MRDVRILLFDGKGKSLGELSVLAGTLTECNMTLEINGEYALSIATRNHLEVGTRALTHDPSDRWREWVVSEVDESHTNQRNAEGKYHLVRSLQYDLQGVCTGGVAQVGMNLERYPKGVPARTALEHALAGTRRWRVGICDVESTSAIVMGAVSAWERLSQVVKYWGGEIDDEITVEDNKVTMRRVHLLKHIGDTSSKRRLEWGHDLTSISRSPDPGPYYCGIIPLGNGESHLADDGATNISYPLTLNSAFGFKGIYNESLKETFAVKNPDGLIEYPVTTVSYSTDDPNELLIMAYADLHDITTPCIGYTGTVSQFEELGMDAEGVGLGDDVQIIDYEFNEEHPLMAIERVLHIEWPLIHHSEDKKLDIGRFRQTLEKTMAKIAEETDTDDAIIPEVVPVTPVYPVEPIDPVVPVTPIDVDPPFIPEYDPPVPEEIDGYIIVPSESPVDPSDSHWYDGGYIAPDGEYYDSANEYWDERVGYIEQAVADMTGITYDPETGEFYDYEGNVIKPESYIPTNPDEYIPNGYDTGGGSYVPTRYDVASSDRWIHQINGQTLSTGTINFITVGGSGDSGSSGGSNSQEEKVNKQLNTPIKAISEVAEQAARSKNKEETNSNTPANNKKKTVEITAANIAGSHSVDLDDTWGSSMITPGVPVGRWDMWIGQ